MKRIISIVFALALVLGFSLVATTPVAAATLNVPSVSYPTIQSAVDAANPAGGDTIMVAAGTYNERIVIDKPLTLLGTDKHTTIIDGTGMTATGIPPYGNNGILINPGASYHMQDVNITISGFTVQNFAVIGAGGGAGIATDVTYQYKKITISDVIAKDNGMYGLYLPNVLNSHFSHIVVDNNDQIGNGQGYGIGVMTFSSGNTFSDITATNHDSMGIEVMQSNANTFDTITSSNNKYGIYFLIGSSGNTVTGSTITDNTNSGIKLNAYGTPCSNNQIHWSNIIGNAVYGVDATNIGTPATFDAENNWWGCDGGPGAAGCDTVVGSVDYDPWVTALQIATATSTGTASFVATGGPISGLTSVPEGSLPPAAQATKPINFPDGLFSFTITGLTPGQTVSVIITLPPGSAPTQYWKYHASEGGWIQIPMTIVGPPNVIRITLVDGGLGDDDGLPPNGVIVDQGGPGTGAVGWETYPISKARVLLPWIALLAAIMAGAGLLVLRRRRAQS